MSAEVTHIDAMPYSVTIVNEYLGFPILEGGMTNSTGLNDILKRFLDYNQYQRSQFMRVLITNGQNEVVALSVVHQPYTISVTQRRNDHVEAVPKEVVLLACEPGDPIAVNHAPDWFNSALEEGSILPITGDSIDGSDWVYLHVAARGGNVVCKTDDTIGLHKNGELYVRSK